MYFGTINRMIFAELVKVFVLALCGLTGMFLLAGLIQEASQKGLSPTQILFAIPLIIPNTMPFTIPATTLFATCVVYGRMAADNEVLVLRAAGVNIYYLLLPAVTLGVLTTAATATLYYDPIPRSQNLLREQLLKDGERILYGMIKREGGLRQSNLDFVLFVRDVQGKDLIDVVVKKRRPKEASYELVARSQMAKLRIRKVSADELPDDRSRKDAAGPAKTPGIERFQRRKAAGGGDRFELVVFMDRCYVDSLKGETAAELQGQEFTSPLPESIFGKPTEDRPTAQVWVELVANRRRLQAELDDVRAEIDRLRADPNAVHSQNKTNGEVANEYEAYVLKPDQRLIRHTDVEIQMRPALAFGCLCFALVGCPVGIWASRSDYLSVFIICFLPAMFVYYPLLLASLNLAKDYKISPVAAWGADLVGIAASVFLVRRLMKR